MCRDGAGIVGGGSGECADVGKGEAIYRRGQLVSGQSVEAISSTGSRLQGSAAACVNCHRRSGLGAREGRSVIPPITGRYLFRSAAGWAGSDVGYVEGVRDRREPYTEATLARAMRSGIDSEGKPLNTLMPRFRLGDADMAALVDYLKP